MLKTSGRPLYTLERLQRFVTDSEPISFRMDGKIPWHGDGLPILVCFPSVGLASTVVGHYLIRSKNLARIASVRSEFLPPATIVIDSFPNPTVRIHADATMATLVSEFPPPLELITPLASTILDWTSTQHSGLVVAVEGILGKKEQPQNSETREVVLGIPSNPASKTLLEKAGIQILEEGIVGGITAALLNEAAFRDIPLVVLFAMAAEEELPDHGAAARLLESINRLLPNLKIDPQPLIAQSRMIEQAIRTGMKLHRPTEPGPKAAKGPEPSIYG